MKYLKPLRAVLTIAALAFLILIQVWTPIQTYRNKKELQVHEKTDTIAYCPIVFDYDSYSNLLENIKSWESYSAVPYPLGQSMIIGWGHRIAKGEHFASITKAEAQELLEQDISAEINFIYEDIPELTEKQVYALAHLCFNIGRNAFLLSPIYEQVCHNEDITESLLKYAYYKDKHGKMVKSKHLFKQRIFECNLYYNL